MARLVLLLAVLLPACVVPMPFGGGTTPGETAPGEVAFELAGMGGAAVVVPVQINGEGPFSFVVDTGATLTCVDHELAQKLELPERRGVVGRGATIEGTGQATIVSIASLEVGTASARDLTACVVSLGSVREVGLEAHGLLGLNFLRAYRMTLDFDRRALLLEDPSATATR